MEIALAVVLGLLFACVCAAGVAMTALGPGGGARTDTRAPPLPHREPVPTRAPSGPAEPRRRDGAA